MKNYFEGWYFKQQHEEGTVAFIPAIHTNTNSQTASLQIVTENDASCMNFSIENVLLCRHRFFFALANNYFSLDGIHLDIHTKELEAEGNLHFESIQPPAYDVMGPFRFVPFLECRHSVFSMKHKVSGALKLNGKNLCFDCDNGYIEGDRGYSFPKRYLWSQCAFEDNSIMLSVADIPFAGFTFTGIIGIVLFHGQEYRLASYLGAKVLSIGNGTASVRQGKYRLTVEQLGGDCKFLSAPIQGAMTRYIRESISCRVHFQFFREETVLFDVISENASFENEYE